jgi:hypothetical protein
MPPLKPALIGLRAKTARAIAIVLGGPARSPQAIHRAELILSSPHLPATYQPYHTVMELPWSDAQVAVRKSAADIEVLASQALAELVREVKSRGFAVLGVAVVGAPERRLESIGNPHIRAHAAEGVLYRHVLEVAAKENSLKSRALTEKGLFGLAEAELGLSRRVFDSTLACLGEDFGRPWRADEKMAATAAWLALADGGPLRVK